MLIGLTQIKGIGYTFANAILGALKIDPSSNIGFLTDEQVKSIENIIKNPSSENFPPWFLNRRKDLTTGETTHLITSDIDFNIRNDIEREKATNSWRGYRHTFGLKVRGQRTRTTGRKGGAVGVAKGGKVLPAGAGAPGEIAAPTSGAEGAAPTEAGKETPASGAKKEGAAEKKEAGGAKAGGAKKEAAPAEKKDTSAKKEGAKK